MSFVSGGYRYQDEIGSRLARRGSGRQLAIPPADLVPTVARIHEHDPAARIVVDGLFHTINRQPLPPGAIALLHTIPPHAGWASAPLPTITTAATTAAAPTVQRAARSIAVVRPGLDTCFVPARVMQNDTRRIVCVGTITPAKGQLLLVESLAALAGHPQGCELVLLGDERQDPQYVAAVRAAGRGIALHIAGCVPATSVATHLQRADLCVSASRSESFGMAIAEAAACGVPVFAFAAGEIGSFVRDGANGWLLSPDASDERFAARLAEVLAEPGALHKARLAAAKPLLHDWDTVAGEFERACGG